MTTPASQRHCLLTSFARRIGRLGLILMMVLWLLPSGCATDPVLPPALPAPTTDIHNENMFHERVQGLHRISQGAGEAEIVRSFGPPTERRQTGGGWMYVYRLRCPKTGSPFESPGRMVYLNWETRITFDERGRVAAVSHQQ